MSHIMIMNENKNKLLTRIKIFFRYFLFCAKKTTKYHSCIYIITRLCQFVPGLVSNGYQVDMVLFLVSIEVVLRLTAVLEFKLCA